MYLVFICSSLAQDIELVLTCSRDTILAGNTLEVSYNLTNSNRDLPIPEFEGFSILSGPNRSSSMSIINGDMSKEQSLSFLLSPHTEGELIIPSIEINIAGENYKSESKKVFVLPNKKGLKEQGIKEHSKKKSPAKKLKKKRKVYRI